MTYFLVVHERQEIKNRKNNHQLEKINIQGNFNYYCISKTNNPKNYNGKKIFDYLCNSDKIKKIKSVKLTPEML